MVIVGLIALNIFGGKSGTRIDESLEKSIAVLPIRNISGDPDQEHISEGLTGDIISQAIKDQFFREGRIADNCSNL